MSTFRNRMSKAEFLRMMADIVEGDPRPGHVNERLGLTLSDFTGWDDWFGFGEWNRGDSTIRCDIDPNNETGARFLEDHGFIEE